MSRHRHRLVPVAIQHPAGAVDQTNVLFRCSSKCVDPDAYYSLPLHGIWTWKDLNTQSTLDDPGLDSGLVYESAAGQPEPLDREPEFVVGRYAEQVMADRVATEEPGYAICTTDAPYRCWVLQLDDTWLERPYPAAIRQPA